MEKKIEQIKNIIRRYFEADPWTGETSTTFDDNYTAQAAIDDIVNVLG